MAVQKRKSQATKKQAFWKSHLKSWEQSDMLQAEYCRVHKLKPKSFTYWKGKYYKKDVPQAIVPINFLREINSKPEYSALKLIVKKEFEIEVNDGFNPVTLKQLISVLGGF